MVLPPDFTPPMTFLFAILVWMVFTRFVEHEFLAWVCEINASDDENVPNALDKVSGGLVIRDKRLEISLIRKARVGKRVDDVPLIHILGISQVHNAILMFFETLLRAGIEVRPQLMIECQPSATKSPTMAVPPVQLPTPAIPLAFNELTAACLQWEVAPGSMNQPNWLFQETQDGTRAGRLFLNSSSGAIAVVLVALF
ncbi:hypothetical protein RhiJN_12425 [Ceratobasidium sp. AG-Ba]|nr:hypothetical protein RhiJN_12425 [Ceratobasidium sp. AG-Ba]